MTVKIVKDNFSKFAAKSVYRYLKTSSNDESIYASIGYLDSEDHLAFIQGRVPTKTALNDSDEFMGGTDSEFDIQDSLYYSQNNISMHRLYAGGVSRVIKRINWEYGQVYNTWPSSNNYVLVKEYFNGYASFNVYMCIFSPRSASLVQPRGKSYRRLQTSDGYVWKYMYTMSATESYKFLTDKWMPISERVLTSEITGLVNGSERSNLLSVQTNAVPFEASSVLLVGSDSDLYNAVRALYTTATTINNVTTYVKNDQTVLAAGSANVTNWVESPTRDSDSVPVTFSFDMRAWDKNPNSPISKALHADSESLRVTVDYDRSRVTNKFRLTLNNIGVGYFGPIEMVSGTTNWRGLSNVVTGFVANGGGFGYDVTDDLKANNVMLTVKNMPEPDSAMAVVMNNTKYNVVSLVQNPIDYGTKKIGFKDSYITSESMIVNNAAGFAGGTELEIGNAGSGVKVLVSGIDGNKVYFNYTEDTTNALQLKTIFSGDDIRVNGTSVVVATVTKMNDPEVVFNSSDYILSDFRLETVQRDVDQVENLNFLISFDQTIENTAVNLLNSGLEQITVNDFSVRRNTNGVYEFVGTSAADLITLSNLVPNSEYRLTVDLDGRTGSVYAGTFNTVNSSALVSMTFNPGVVEEWYYNHPGTYSVTLYINGTKVVNTNNPVAFTVTAV